MIVTIPNVGDYDNSKSIMEQPFAVQEWCFELTQTEPTNVENEHCAMVQSNDVCRPIKCEWMSSNLKLTQTKIYTTGKTAHDAFRPNATQYKLEEESNGL